MQRQGNAIRAIIGLGNPGAKYYHHRHTIGFRVLDVLADRYSGTFRTQGNAEIAEINIDGRAIMLIKPQTYMNTSGAVLPALLKRGIKADELLVVHDEIELPFGTTKYKFDGSHKGHNGLKSIMEYIGKGFHRVRFGVGRPDDKDHVPHYVLSNFSEGNDAVEHAIVHAVDLIEQLVSL